MSDRNFFAELKRRNVYKVAVAYAVVGWLAVQISSTVLPTFHAPEWVLQTLVVLVVLGFLIALVIAWAFEMTPQGIKRTEDVSPDEKLPESSRHKFLAMTSIVALLAAGLLAFQLMRGKHAVPSEISDKSIAVLPFASLSEDKANAYFADGIQDEILTRLSKIAQLKVISRTSTQQYQSKPGNLSEIARQLGVAHILEGSVQKSNDSVRVNVQLIKADGDSHLWAETYDRKLTDIFAVESEVAQRIAGSLEARLTGREQQQLADVPTKDPHAYEAYLRGRTLLNVQGFQAIENAIGFLRKAVELDPQYAAAWAQLAMAESQRYGYERTPPQLELAKRAAETALRLQPELAEAHEGVGAYIYYCLHDFDRALAEMEEARSRSPNDAEVILYIGLLKRRQGKLEEAIEYQHKATVFDPRNSDIWVNLSGSYRGKRDFGNALSTIDQALAISPDELDIVGDKAEIYAAQGDLDSVDNVLRGHKIAPHTEARYQQTNALLCRRRFDDALAQYSAMENDVAQPALVLARRKGQLGQLQWFAGQPEQARQSLEEARRELIAIRDGGNTSDDLLAGLVLVDGFLADRPELEREADVFLKQTSRDKWQYGLSEQIVAAAYAVTGNADRALPLIEKALSISCDSSLTRANLRQHPVWDGVRNDPRFVKLVSGAPN